jgi:hypothetical protein
MARKGEVTRQERLSVDRLKLHQKTPVFLLSSFPSFHGPLGRTTQWRHLPKKLRHRSPGNTVNGFSGLLPQSRDPFTAMRGYCVEEDLFLRAARRNFLRGYDWPAFLIEQGRLVPAPVRNEVEACRLPAIREIGSAATFYDAYPKAPAAHGTSSGQYPHFSKHALRCITQVDGMVFLRVRNTSSSIGLCRFMG